MRIVSDISAMQAAADDIRRDGKRIGFVPTMGYFHAGHLDLMRIARQQTDLAVASLFVNPSQFGKNEDLARYPRDLARDAALAEAAGIDILFTPSEDAMYCPGFRTWISVDEFSSVLEGAVRPDHFRGVATVVAKLFNIVKPHVAVFGQKDAQQSVIIRRMAADLNFDVEILVAPTRREEDGLAMSSRNTYLAPAERQHARALSRGLLRAADAYHNGERRAATLEGIATTSLHDVPGIVIDYVQLVDADTLATRDIVEDGTRAFLLLAARIGTTRLIDNILLGEES